MFFPKDVLVRKGKFGIIWIAGTHTSGRCDFLSKRDYFNVNIPRTCHDILHPSIPFALRLSSHLMFGVSKIYQKQTKITLDETQHMWVRVNEAFDKRRSLELYTTCARLDSITIADPIKSATMDFLLEPFREDIMPYDAPLFHARDASFLEVNGSINIFASPSKSSVMSSSSEAVTSPMQADKKDITMPEDVFSPNKPIEVPGEVDFGPYLEEDPFEKLESEMVEVGKLVDKREDVNELSSREARPAVVPSRDEMTQYHGVEDIEIPVEDPIAISAQTDKGTSSKRDLSKDWEGDQATPRSVPAFQERKATVHPAKRRRLTIDREIKLSGDFIRANLSDPSSTMKQVVIGGVRRQTINELFSMPTVTYLANEGMKSIWKQSARTSSDPHLHENFHVAFDEFRLESPDRVLLSGVTPSSIEIPRAIEDLSTEFERSAGSSLGMESLSRVKDAARSIKRKSIEQDLMPIDQKRSSLARSSQIGFGILSPIADEFGEEFAVPLEDIDEAGILQESSEDDLPSPKQDEFLRDLVDVFEDRNKICFPEIAVPGRMKRKVAARAFFYTLALAARHIIDVNQETEYGEITVTRGSKF